MGGIMKKHISKIAASLILALSFSSLPAVALANSNDAAQPLASSFIAKDQPDAEETGYFYCYLNGKKYKRLWSYTYNRWIDPYWIPCNDNE